MRALLLVVVCAGVCAAQTTARRADITVASGKLEHHFLTNDLFHIDKLWIEAASDSLFHRWLSQGINDTVAIILTTDPDQFGDRPNVRIMSGTLVHELAPSTTPIVHVLFLRDEATGTVGSVVFETADPVLAQKFDAYDDQEVSIVIAIASAVR